MAENPHNEVHNEPHYEGVSLIMNALSRFSAIMNPQNLVMIVSLMMRCIMRLLVFQCGVDWARSAPKP